MNTLKMQLTIIFSRILLSDSFLKIMRLHFYVRRFVVSKISLDHVIKRPLRHLKKNACKPWVVVVLSCQPRMTELGKLSTVGNQVQRQTCLSFNDDIISKPPTRPLILSCMKTPVIQINSNRIASLSMVIWYGHQQWKRYRHKRLIRL